MSMSKPNRTKASKKKDSTAPAGKKKTAANDTIRLNVNVPREMYRQLRIKAAEKETSISRSVIGLIENYVAKR